MQLNIKKIASAITMSSVVFSGATPMVLADTLTGNGASSVNVSNSTHNSSLTSVQSNSADISYDVNTNLSTGFNSASDNVGGDVFVISGNAESNVDLTTIANLNEAVVADHHGGAATDNRIEANGAYSFNSATEEVNHDTSVFQSNEARVDKNVNNTLQTGFNSADRNTGGQGGSDVRVISGHARTEVDLFTALNANKAEIMPRHSGGQGGQQHDSQIMNNGAYSVNSIDVLHNKSMQLVQDNEARVDAAVRNDLNTGFNSADDNTNAEVGVDSGWAESRVFGDTLANFNMAVLGAEVSMHGGEDSKIQSNGAFSRNYLTAEVNDDMSEFQDNWLSGNIWVGGNQSTGFNAADRNTGGVVYPGGQGGHNDPFVFSGNSRSYTDFSTAANVNLLGHGEHVNFDFDFDPHALFDMFRML